MASGIELLSGMDNLVLFRYFIDLSPTLMSNYLILFNYLSYFSEEDNSGIENSLLSYSFYY